MDPQVCTSTSTKIQNSYITHDYTWKVHSASPTLRLFRTFNRLTLYSSFRVAKVSPHITMRCSILKIIIVAIRCNYLLHDCCHSLQLVRVRDRVRVRVRVRFRVRVRITTIFVKKLFFLINDNFFNRMTKKTFSYETGLTCVWKREKVNLRVGPENYFGPLGFLTHICISINNMYHIQRIQRIIWNSHEDRSHFFLVNKQLNT